MFEVVLGEKRTCLLACQLFSIMFRNLRVTFCSFRASALMIMSALSPWMFAACSPCPLWFSSPDVPCLIHKCCHSSSLQGLSQSMEFIYESAPGLGFHAHTLVEHPQPEGVPSWAHSPSLPWFLCSSQALLQLAWHLILAATFPSCPSQGQQ